MEKPHNNFSPNPEERVITPDVVEEGLQKMREEAMKKVVDEFDALRARRDFLDKSFFKRERQRTMEALSDDPAQRSTEIKNLHHERFLQAGAKLFHVTEEVARNNIFISGEELRKAVEERFKKDRLPMSKNQRAMLAYAGEIWDEDKKEIRDYIKEVHDYLLKGSQSFSQEDENVNVFKKDALALKELKDYKNAADLRKINDLINNNYYLKSRLIYDLGYQIKTAGENFNLSKEESEHNLDTITVDLLSYHPIILVTVENKTLWDNSGNENCGAFYHRGEGFKSMGIYTLESEEIEKSPGRFEHEFQHAIRHRFFNKIKNRMITEKVALSKEGVRDLEKTERLIGAMYEFPRSDKVTSMQEDFPLKVKIKETQGNIEKRIQVSRNKDGDFWHNAQNEFCSYLERSKRKDWMGYLEPFITKAIYEDINEKGLVSKEALMDFNMLHDLVAFYLSAGFGYEEITDVIRTSKNFKIAQQRIEQNFRLNSERVKKAIDPDNELSYRNMIKILDTVEKYNQVEYFFENFNPRKAETLLHHLLLNAEDKEILVHEITENSRLFNEKNVQTALNKIIGMYIKNDTVNKYLRTNNIDKAAESLLLMQNIQKFSQGILQLRIELLEIFEEQPNVIRKIILCRLSKRIHSNLEDKEAMKEILHSVDNELLSLEELRNLGDLKESWLFKDPADELNCGILDKWLNLPGEKRRSFIDRIKEAYAQNPEGLFILYHLERLVEG